MTDKEYMEIREENARRREQKRDEAKALLLKEFPELEADYNDSKLDTNPISEVNYYANAYTVYNIQPCYHYASKRNTDMQNHIEFISELNYGERLTIKSFLNGYIVADYHKLMDEIRVHYFTSKGQSNGKGKRTYVKAYTDKNGLYFKRGNNKVYLD